MTLTRSRSDISRIFTQVREAAQSTAEAKTLPRECYTDQGWYDFEKEAIFARSWICVGRHDYVKDPGDYVRVDIGDEPLVIVKDYDGTIRVLSAVCSHRGHIVCEGAGNCGKVLRCPLHFWSYGLDGRLITAPSMSKTIPLSDLKSQAYLPQLKTEIWNGFIFANMNPDAPALRPTLSKLESDLEPYELGRLLDAEVADSPDNPWNWKILLENGLEPYHTAYLHMTIHDFAHVKLASFVPWDDDDGAIYHPTGFYHLDGGFNATQKAFLPVFRGLSERERKQVIFGAIPPTLLFGVLPDHLVYFLVTPSGPQTCDLRVGWSYAPEQMELSMFPHLHKATREGSAMLAEQDRPANASLQRGARSRFRRPAPRYCYQEETLVQFNRWLAKRYGEYLEDGGTLEVDGNEAE